MIQSLQKVISLQAKRDRRTPGMVTLASLLPGLGLAWLGKRRPAGGVVLACLISLLLVILRPSFPGLLLFGLVYLGQMVWSAVLAVWQEPNQLPDTGDRVILPPRLTKLDQKSALGLLHSSSPTRGLDNQTLVTWLAGYDANLRQPQVLALMPTGLILLRCTPDGSPAALEQIPIPKVFWIALEIWQHHCLLMIEFTGNLRPPIILRLPRQAARQAFQLFDTFYGTYDYKVPIQQVIEPTRPIEVRPADLLISLAALLMVAFGALRSNIILDSLSLWSMAAGCFLIPWPRLVWTLRLMRAGTEPGIIAYLAAILTGILSLVGWGIALLLTGLGLGI